MPLPTKVYCRIIRKSDSSLAWEGWAMTVLDAWNALEHRIKLVEYFSVEKFAMACSEPEEFTPGKRMFWP